LIPRGPKFGRCFHYRRRRCLLLKAFRTNNLTRFSGNFKTSVTQRAG
jgi:hypothetical protein